MVAEWYGAYTRSAHWRETKLCLLASRAGRKCEICHRRKYKVVHHMSYLRIGGEKLEDLQLLCGKCHKALHLDLLRRGESLPGLEMIRQPMPPSRVVPLLPMSYMRKVVKRGKW